jgi:glycosyltransferase involved in cell wall biosynthesis
MALATSERSAASGAALCPLCLAVFPAAPAWAAGSNRLGSMITPDRPSPCLLIFASFDPRGGKIGGIETHIRALLRNSPEDFDLILAGIDEIGDLPLGKPVTLPFGGREITFLPLIHWPAEAVARSATRLFQSTTLRFVLGGLRHLGALRALTRGRAVSADLPRVEFAILPWLLGIPFALTLHSDLFEIKKTASLLRHFGRLKRWSEAFAFKFAQRLYAVSAPIAAGLARIGPEIAAKTRNLNVPVDTKVFFATPIPPVEPVFRVVYAGRFEAVKDPALMFRTIELLSAARPGGVEFHLIGLDDPTLYPEFSAIAAITTRHGGQNSEGVARIIADAHCGLMTSHTEGLPCFLLETLASGRPFVGTKLPSFEPLIFEGETGALVARCLEDQETAFRLAEALTRVQAGIINGTYQPAPIAAHAQPYSADVLLNGFFEHHRDLAFSARISSNSRS